LKALQT
jgi:hypothetical protein